MEENLNRFMVAENRQLRPGVKYVICTSTWSVWQVGANGLARFNPGRERYYDMIKEMRSFWNNYPK